MLHYEVGDELYLNGRIIKIDKISKTGRITCGNTVLDPNLRVRGRGTGWNGDYSAQDVTEKIRNDVRKKELLCLLRDKKFYSLSLEQLEKIIEITGE